ncbi:MAG: phytanoyl-CoA dioxygenase family protein [Candidatus Latescibacterota bacterium]|nr:phytanoyl-CoA dioxygenase family protein [Candidatus Latescibacterota bacterium]
MTEQEELNQYLFDLQGYLVLEDVLDDEVLATLNEHLDAQQLDPPERGLRFGSAPEGSGFLGWGQSFVDLLDHEAVMPVLRQRLGDCFRLDRIYGIQMSQGIRRGRLHSDYGASSFTSTVAPGEYYQPHGNEIVDGFVVVAWNLSEAGPGCGGFCCIPGSHKSHYLLPESIKEAGEDSAGVVVPSAPAGSTVLFTESLTHGTASWTAAHERRCLLYKYCVSHIAWTSGRMQQPDNAALTDRQQMLFRDPSEPHRFFPSLFETE